MWKICLSAAPNIGLTQPSWPLEAAFFSGEAFVTNLGPIFGMYPPLNPSLSEGSDVHVAYFISSAVNTQTWGTTFSYILLLSDFFILWLLPGNREWIWFLIPKSVKEQMTKCLLPPVTGTLTSFLCCPIGIVWFSLDPLISAPWKLSIVSFKADPAALTLSHLWLFHSSWQEEPSSCFSLWRPWELESSDFLPFNLPVGRVRFFSVFFLHTTLYWGSMISFMHPVT